jgi:hypothetical protein
MQRDTRILLTSGHCTSLAVHNFGTLDLRARLTESYIVITGAEGACQTQSMLNVAWTHAGKYENMPVHMYPWLGKQGASSPIQLVPELRCLGVVYLFCSAGGGFLRVTFKTKLHI